MRVLLLILVSIVGFRKGVEKGSFRRGQKVNAKSEK